MGDLETISYLVRLHQLLRLADVDIRSSEVEGFFGFSQFIPKVIHVLIIDDFTRFLVDEHGLL